MQFLMTTRGIDHVSMLAPIPKTYYLQVSHLAGSLAFYIHTLLYFST